MIGGPCPDNDGKIMSYLWVRSLEYFIVLDTYKRDTRSHTGKTKVGETHEKFLGQKEYDDNLRTWLVATIYIM